MSDAFSQMSGGGLYDPGDPDLADLADRNTRAQRLCGEYNLTVRGEAAARDRILTALLGTCGSGVVIRPTFFCDYGSNIHLADGVFLNHGCVILDVCPVRIGARTQIGPMSQLLAADHPRDPAIRARGLENGRPVSIGADCWIGAGALILPGVTVGDGAVVGAGAVVTRDVAAGATVAGNPARPLKPGVPDQRP